MQTLAGLLVADGIGPRVFRNAFWSHWPEKHRRAVVEGFWEVGEEDSKADVTKSIARWLRYRPPSVNKAPLQQKVEWVLRLCDVRSEPGIAYDVAAHYLIFGCGPLWEGFSERCGIDFSSVFSGDCSLPTAEVTRDTLTWAREAFPLWQLELLLATVAAVDPRWRPLVRDILNAEGPTTDVQEPFGATGADIAVTDTATTDEDVAAATTVGAAREPENARDFTTLDTVVIKSIVASLTNVEGALHLEAVEDLVDELVALNADRHRSFFHRGYLDVLRHREPSFSFPGENESRRSWYLAGVLMGLTRLDRPEEVVALYDRHRDGLRSLLIRPTDEAVMVAPHVFHALRGVGRWGDALEAISGTFGSLKPRFATDLLSEASDMLRRGRVPEAHQVLQFLQGRRQVIDEKLRDTSDESAQLFDERLDRKLAQCLQAEGELILAKAVLDRLLDTERPRELASILADRGLIEGGFKGLQEVRIPDRAEDEQQIRGALERGRSFFERAMGEDRDYALNAAYCLGVLALLRGEEESAIRGLTLAVAMMSRQADSYGAAGLLVRAEFLLGLVLLESAEPEQARYAGELVVGALRARVDMPIRWLGRVVMAASMYGEQLTADLCGEACVAYGQRAIEAVADVSNTLRVGAVRDAVRLRAESETEPINQRWADWERLLRHYLDTRALEDAAQVLDTLESLSQQPPESHRFLSLLSDPARYDPAWSREDALWARVRLLEGLGRYEGAAALLTQAFHAVLVEPDDQGLDEAHGILARIRSYGLAEFDLGVLTRRLEAVARRVREQGPSVEGDHILAKGLPIRVMLVGGTEAQARHDDALREEIEQAYPRVRVEFVHTHMSSNWGRQLDDMRARLCMADAVVVMRLIRTQLGRAIRPMCRIWVPCVGQGKDSMRRAIVRAAVVAAREQHR